MNAVDILKFSYLEIAASAVDQMPLEERGVRVGLMKYSAHADVLVKLKDGQNKNDVIKYFFSMLIQYFIMKLGRC